MDILREIPQIVDKLSLSKDELPVFTTVCARKQDLKLRSWRVLVHLSAELHYTGEMQAIDSTSFAHRSSSYNYAIRVEDTFESVKITPLVDCKTGAILDIHCPMNQPHDTHVAWKVLARNISKLDTVVADKGFDWDDLRHKLREEGIRPEIMHRKFYSLEAAHNTRIDDTYTIENRLQSRYSRSPGAIRLNDPSQNLVWTVS